jgi:tRNA 2-selenouridine synthase
MTSTRLSVFEFLLQSKAQLIIDVRAPIEFYKGNVPNAINIPLFEDVERAEIGTLYKQQGKDIAVTRGLEIVSPKMVAFVNQVRALCQSKKVFVYCFRGGMRSSSFAWLLQTSGFEVCLMQGGYKAYRNYVLEAFEQPKNIVLLGGKTGSGKTDVLLELAKLNIQTINLERIANHKGSAFGSINEPKQNPQQIFENILSEHFMATNNSRVVVVEDESKNIGYNKIPHTLWLQMTKATIIKLEVPFELRVQKLVQDYATVNIAALKACVLKIEQHLGHQNTALCLQHLDNNNLADVAKLALHYYDKAYNYQYQNKKQHIVELQCSTLDATTNAIKVAEVLETLN